MSLDFSSQNRRKEDQQMADPVTPSPARAPGAPKRGRPFGSSNQGATGLRGKCWWLMRELSTFTINRLLETYADGTEKDAHNNVDNYLFRLQACDVVERLDRRQPGDALTSPGFVVWRLKRNLGLLAPVWRREQKVLWDPNAGQVVPLKTAQSEEQQDSPVPSSEPDFHD